MCASLDENSYTTTASCNSPTNSSDEMDITAFYNKLSPLGRHISKDDVLIIQRDMNKKKNR